MVEVLQDREKRRDRDEGKIEKRSWGTGKPVSASGINQHQVYAGGRPTKAAVAPPAFMLLELRPQLSFILPTALPPAMLPPMPC